MNITEFLEARIAEDEARANAAKVWVANGPNPYFSWFGSPGESIGPRRFGVASPHIAAMSPARVLAECAAKRAIVLQHADASTSWDCTADESRCPTLKALAAIYSDRPDYQQEWAVA